MEGGKEGRKKEGREEKTDVPMPAAGAVAAWNVTRTGRGRKEDVASVRVVCVYGRCAE